MGRRGAQDETRIVWGRDPLLMARIHIQEAPALDIAVRGRERSIWRLTHKWSHGSDERPARLVVHLLYPREEEGVGQSVPVITCLGVQAARSFMEGRW